MKNFFVRYFIITWGFFALPLYSMEKKPQHKAYAIQNQPNTLLDFSLIPTELKLLFLEKLIQISSSIHEATDNVLNFGSTDKTNYAVIHNDSIIELLINHFSPNTFLKDVVVGHYTTPSRLSTITYWASKLIKNSTKSSNSEANFSFASRLLEKLFINRYSQNSLFFSHFLSSLKLNKSFNATLQSKCRALEKICWKNVDLGSCSSSDLSTLLTARPQQKIDSTHCASYTLSYELLNAIAQEYVKRLGTCREISLSKESSTLLLKHAAIDTNRSQSLIIIKNILSNHQDLINKPLNHLQQTLIMIMLQNKNFTDDDIKTILPYKPSLAITDKAKRNAYWCAYNWSRYNMLVSLQSNLLSTIKDIDAMNKVEQVKSLFYAIKNSDYNLVKLLLEKNKYLVNEYLNGETGSHVAVRKGLKEITELLLTYFPNINARRRDDDGYTPLVIAIKNDDISIIKLLLEYGALLSFQINSNSKAYYYLTDCSKETISTVWNHLTKPQKQTLMTIAAAQGLIEYMKWFKNNGINYDDLDERDLTALMTASYYNQLKTVKFLILQKVLVNQTNSQLFSALYYATEAGHAIIVKTLIEQGGATMEHWFINIIPLVLLKLAALNKDDNPSTLNELVKHIKKFKTTDESIFYIAEAVISKGNKRCLEALLSHYNTLIDYQHTDFNLEASHDISERYINYTLLAHAITNKRWRCATLLIKKSSSPTYIYTYNDKKYNPLLHAIDNDASLELIQLLVQKGANVNERVNGKSPLKLATNKQQHTVAKYLITAGAKS